MNKRIVCVVVVDDHVVFVAIEGDDFQARIDRALRSFGVTPCQHKEIVGILLGNEEEPCTT